MLLSIRSTDIAAEVLQAKKRLYFCGAGLDVILANAIVKAAADPKVEVLIFVDAGAHARRLGYGNHDAIAQLHKADVAVYDLANTRLSFCVIDQKAWVFSQTAALVEQPDSSNGLNCVELTGVEVNYLADSVRMLHQQSGHKTQKDTLNLFPNGLTVQVKPELLTKSKLENTSQQLMVNPPQSFDVSRQVTVFNSRLEFVELELTGAQIERHVFKFPDEIKKLFTDSVDAQKRLSASYKMIGDNSKVSSKELTQQLEQIRNLFLKPVGKLGRVILRAQKQNFERELEYFRKNINKYQRSLEKNLTKELEKSKNELINAVLDRVHKNPPEALRFNVDTPKVTKQQAKQYLDYLFDRHMPLPEKLTGAIELKCIYKGVTYETLKNPEFVAQVQKQFPHVDWQKPLQEYIAAKSAHASKDKAR